VHSGIEIAVSYGEPIVNVIDQKIDSLIGKASDVKNVIVIKYNNRKDEVMTRAKGYKAAISEQVQTTISCANVNDLKSRVEESVKQAPEVVRSLSNKAVSLTKQGLEISIGQEKTESVLNSVKTHTPKFVSSLLSSEAPEPAIVSESPVVAAH
jgi:hypothetical protein